MQSRPNSETSATQTALFVVRACPGSGKTRTTATRFAWRMANWQSRHSGIAVLSFTNIAWKEIGQQLHLLGFPPTVVAAFSGHNRRICESAIFLPFGHSILGCKCRPEIVDGGTRPWVADHIRDRSQHLFISRDAARCTLNLTFRGSSNTQDRSISRRDVGETVVLT